MASRLGWGRDNTDRLRRFDTYLFEQFGAAPASRQAPVTAS